MKQENNKIIDSIVNVAVPLVYLCLWYLIPLWMFGTEKLPISTLIVTGLPVLFMGIISRQTTWSIFGDNGIKGDNIGRKVKATIDGRGSIEIQGLDLDKEKMNSIIDAVTENERS